MCNKVLLLLGKMPQRNFYANCHVNGTTFQSGLRFQTGSSSLRVSCKRALSSSANGIIVFKLTIMPFTLQILLKKR